MGVWDYQTSIALNSSFLIQRSSFSFGGLAPAVPVADFQCPSLIDSFMRTNRQYSSFSVHHSSSPGSQ
jgi:hypothetical protein